MKAMKKIIEKCVRNMVNINEMQFRFMSGRGTTDAIYFFLHQLKEKVLTKNRTLSFAFIDLNVFNRVPCDVLLWAMRKVGVEEWLVRVVQLMYKKPDQPSQSWGLMQGSL